MKARPSAHVLNNMRDDYPQLVQWVRDNSLPVNVDGELLYEVRDVSIVLEDPLDSLPLGTGTKADPAVGAAGALQFIGGTADIDLVNRMIPGLMGTTAILPVSLRAQNQLPELERALRWAPSTQEALLTLWDPVYDRNLLEAPKASALTVSLQFFYRDEKLELHRHARCLDVLATALDYFIHAQVLLTMANVLGVTAGELHTHTASLVLYAKDLMALDLMHVTTEKTRPTGLPVGLVGDTWLEVADRARFLLDVATGRVADGVNKDAFSASELWYLDALRPYWRAQEA